VQEFTRARWLGDVDALDVHDGRILVPFVLDERLLTDRLAWMGPCPGLRGAPGCW
jgi:hypothetical protein